MEIKVNITIGLMSNITKRALEPIKSFLPTNQVVVNEVGRFWLKICAYNYMINHSEFGNPEEGSNFDNFFPKYEEMIKNGGEESWQVPPIDITLIFSEDRLPVVLTGSPIQRISLYNESNCAALDIVVENNAILFRGSWIGAI